MADNEVISGIFALVGVAIGGGLTFGIELWRDRHSRNRDRILTTAICSSELRMFAERCNDVAWDDGTYLGQMAGRHQDGQEYLEAQVKSPKLPQWSTEMKWGALDATYMQRIFQLPIEYRYMQGALEDVRQNDFPPFDDTFASRQASYASMGLHALDLAHCLEMSAGLISPNDDRARRQLSEIFLRYRSSNVGPERAIDNDISVKSADG